MRLSAFALVAMLTCPLTSVTAHAQSRPLNDTGITLCGAYPSGNTAAPCTPAPAGQDTHYGRDAAAQGGVLVKIGGSVDPANGFDYTKIANNGTELPASAALGSGATDWACTRDNVTGRTWEVKVNDNMQQRHQGHGYTWYDPASADGNPGALGTTGTCNATLGVSACNTSNYVTAVNTAQLCGFSDWRMPTVKELEGIADLNRVSPAIDPDYFPNTPSWPFWSGSPYAGHSNGAWTVYSGSGGAYSEDEGYESRSYIRLVRLVRGGQ